MMTKQFGSSAVALFALIFSSLQLSALELDPASTLTEDDYLAEIPIILSASRLSQPESEASTTISVITREMIDASTAKNIPDLLRLVPGFQVGYFNGNVPVVTYHGMTEQYSRRIQVLIDGRSIYTPTFGGVLWASLPITLDEIERIEISRGPNASSYGSNSFFAVVSIKTYNAYDTQGNYLRVIRGDNHRHQTLFRVGAQTDKAEYRVTLSHRGDDGHDIAADSNDENLLKLRLDYNLSDQSQVSYQAGINHKDYLKEANNSAPTHEFTTDTFYHHIKWEKTLDENSSISMQYYYNHYELLDQTLSFFITGDDIELTPGVTVNDALAPFSLDPFQVLVDESNQAERHDIELNYYYSPNESIRTVSGFSLRQDSVKSERLFNTKEEFITDIGRLFGHIEWRVNQKLIVNTGLMIENHEVSETSYSPRLSIIRKITPEQSLRFGVSTATRAPSTVEESINAIYHPSLTVGGTGICILIPSLSCSNGIDIYPIPVFVTNGGVDFEHITSTEIGYHGELLNNRLTMDAKIFYDEVTDLIVQQANDSFENSQGVILKGLEYSLKYSPSNRYLFTFNYAYLDIEDEIPAGITQQEIYANTAPEHSYSLTLFTKLNKDYAASLEYINVGEMYWTDVSDPIEAFDILNLKLTRTIKLKKSTLQTSLILRNVSGDYNDYGEYSNITESVMSSRIALDIQLLNF